MSVRLLALTVVVTGCALLAPVAAEAAPKCPAKRHTLAKKDGSVVWARHGTLYGCSTEDDLKPTPRALGPWTGGKLVFEGFQAAWTTTDGDGTQRVWAAAIVANAPNHAWLAGKRVVPASGDAPARDAEVQRLIEDGDALAYVTTDGDVVLAANGNGTPENHHGSIVLDPNPAFPTPPLPSHRQTLLGSYPTSDPASIADSMELTNDPDCGGEVSYRFRFTPADTAITVDFTADTGQVADADGPSAVCE